MIFWNSLLNIWRYCSILRTNPTILTFLFVFIPVFLFLGSNHIWNISRSKWAWILSQKWTSFWNSSSNFRSTSKQSLEILKLLWCRDTSSKPFHDWKNVNDPMKLFRLIKWKSYLEIILFFTIFRWTYPFNNSTSRILIVALHIK